MLAIGAGHLGVHVEPVLHGLGEVFLLVGGTIGALEDAACLCLLVESLQARVEGGVDLYDADAVDGMGELMDEDVLSMVFVNLVRQHVLLGTRGQRLVDGAAKATGTEVPVQRRVVDEVVMLGQVGSALVARHNGHAGIGLLHGLEYLGTQHRRHGIERAMGSHEGRVGHAPRRHEGQSVHVDILRVELVVAQGVRHGCDLALGHDERIYRLSPFPSL